MKNNINFLDQVEIEGFSDYAQVKCYDGFAIATAYNKRLCLKYPKLSELSEDDRRKVLEYVGVNDSDEIRFSDVMLMHGKPTTSHHLIISIIN